jgi:CDP-diacylglycerol---serine O-phosphatidyltransferase
MKTLFSIPNLLSLGNLLCGCIATLTVIRGDLYPAVFLIGLACVFDFLDGFAARGLKQGSPMGKELDSLADMVTFGIVPGMIMFQLIAAGNFYPAYDNRPNGNWETYLPYVGFIIPLFSGLRLAKFNVDTRQSESFIGLPILANAIFMAGLPSWLNLSSTSHQTLKTFPEFDFLANPFFLSALAVGMSVLLLSPLPMFSFKIKQVGWKGNEIRYVFLALSLVLAFVLRWKALSVIVVAYVLLSVVNLLVKKK